jgi:eukaryotic-like serine/threonine-protein kinase
MPLSAGTRLGSYEILAPLGAGGMGEVYRARDSLLKRDVAVKVLPAYCSRDPERLRRFQIEAESAASLSHPNIVSIFHVGNDEGTHYIVTELLVGETLRERLRRGRLGLREVLDFGFQVARGLAAAHAVGIVHRDLKPENLFIAKDGHIKILDFGLAKLEPAKAASADGVTVTMLQQTSPGYVLGTVGYMSPEQVKGQPADVRSDIFSFGLVLYEMLTGQRAFAKATPAETMSAILGEDPPPISQTAPACPPVLQRIVDRCLRKEPDQRIQNALDLAFALEALSDSTSATLPAGRQMASSKNWKRMVPALAAIAVAAVALGWWTLPAAIRFVRSTRSTDAMPLRLEVRLPNAETFAVSPNGQMLAFVVAGENRHNVIWIRALNSLELRELPGTEDATGAPIFWSPDSRFVGFQASNKLKKIDVSGGKLPQEICETSAFVLGGAWNRADVIVFGTTDGVMQVPAAGGVPALVTAAKNRNEAHAFPSFLPDGRHFIYIRAPQEIGIYVGSLDAKPDQQSSKRMLATTVMASYVASHDQAPGRLLFMREGSLWAQSFDAQRFELFGEPVPVARHVSRFLLSAAFSASETGILAYRSSFANTRLSWFDRQGKELGDLHESIASTHVVDLSLSPDGTQLATTRVNPNSPDLGVALWITDLGRGVSTRLSSEQLFGSSVWSADGRHLAFSVTRPGGTAIIQKASNGGGGEQLLVGISPDEKFPNDWSGDGRALLYTRREPGKNASLWLVDIANRPNQPAAPTPFADSEFNNGQGQFSPDRRWVAYTSDESGRSEVYVQELSSSQGTGVKTQVSRDGGREPHWRQDGRELFYLSMDGKLMSLKLTAGPMFKASIPQPLFQVADIRGALGITAYHWGVTPDGKRFLIARDPLSSEPISIVVNWLTELNLR